MEDVALLAATCTLCCRPEKKVGCAAEAGLEAVWLSMSPAEYLFHSASTDAGGSAELAPLPASPRKKSIAVLAGAAGGSRDMRGAPPAPRRCQMLLA